MALPLVAACPHDWSRFEDVPTVPAGGVDASGDVGADTTADGASVALPFAKLGENPVLIAADDDGIVFTTAAGSVLACRHSGCDTLTTIAAGQHDVRALAIGYGFVAWVARGDNAIRRASRVPGAAPLVEVTDDDGLSAVALAPGRVYWAVDALGLVFTNAGIRSCAPGESCDGITFDGFADGFASELVIDGADAFWLGEAKVFGCPLGACQNDGHQRTTLASELIEPHALAVANGEVFYGSPIEGGSIRAVARVTTGTPSGAPRLVVKGLGNISRLAITNASVWVTNGPGGTVTRAPRAGGPAVTVASDLAAPTGIARGGGYVYVACSGDGRIFRFGEE